MTRGKFITFEGPDGAGKTTQLQEAALNLQAKGYTVVVTREPGGTPLAEKLRTILLNDPCDGLTELLILFAGRRDHIKQVIEPALERGEIVISDRFVDSSYAYQAVGRGLKEEFLKVRELVLGSFEPDYTLFFNIPLQTGIERLARRRGLPLDRFEAESRDFIQRVHAGYVETLTNNPHRMVEFDANPDSQTVQQRVAAWLDTKFPDLR